MINFNAIYVLWLRDMKWFFRTKSRLVSSLIIPFLILIFMGTGLKKILMQGNELPYDQFIIPGIIAMNLLFSSAQAGLAVLWDKNFGFLKEILVSPVNRISIVIGKILGSATSALFRATLILIVALIFFGLRISLLDLFFAILLMIVIASIFISMGIMVASVMKDMQGFGLIINFVVFPMFFLSGAMFPVDNLPTVLRYLCYLDPLTYAVDALRYVLIGVSSLPILLDIVLLGIFLIIMLYLSAYFFEKTDL